MNAINVRPKKWIHDEYPIKVLYDDGYYSVIWGKYNKDKVVGVRYNDDDNESEIGYPHQGANPTWYIEPDFIAIAILQRLLLLALDRDKNADLNNIKYAINELTNKMKRA